MLYAIWTFIASSVTRYARKRAAAFKAYRSELKTRLNFKTALGRAGRELSQRMQRMYAAQFVIFWMACMFMALYTPILIHVTSKLSRLFTTPGGLAMTIALGLVLLVWAFQAGAYRTLRGIAYGGIGLFSFYLFMAIMAATEVLDDSAGDRFLAAAIIVIVFCRLMTEQRETKLQVMAQR